MEMIYANVICECVKVENIYFGFGGKMHDAALATLQSALLCSAKKRKLYVGSCIYSKL